MLCLPVFGPLWSTYGCFSLLPLSRHQKRKAARCRQLSLTLQHAIMFCLAAEISGLKANAPVSFGT